MIRACSGQVRASMGGVFAVDFGAVLAFAQALYGSVPVLLADLLPDVEPLIVRHYQPEEGDDGDT